MSKSTETKTKAAPWESAKTPLRNVMRTAEDMYRNNTMEVDPYAGPRVAEFSPQTIAALETMDSTAPFQERGMQYITDTLDDAGMYRDFDKIKGIVGDDVKAALGSTFSGGTINSSLAGDTYTRALGEALAIPEFDAYNAGKGRQLAALDMMPSIAGVGKGAVAAGAMRDDLAQRKIDADATRYYEEENKDMDALKQYASIVQGIGGMGGTTVNAQSMPWYSGLTSIGNAAMGAGGFWGAFG